MNSLPPEIPYLLAKWRDYDYATKEHFMPRGSKLPGHVAECARMADYLLNRSRFGSRLFIVMDLGRFITEDTFRRLCMLSILCHDLGKAGHEFQTFLWQMEHEWSKWMDQDPGTRGDFKKPWGNNRYSQRYRHEALTFFMMTKVPAIWSWLVQESGSEANALMVVCGSFGHHRKTDMAMAVKDKDEPKTNPAFVESVTQLMNRLTPKYGFTPFPVCPDIEVSPKQIYQDVRTFHGDHMDDDEETPVSAAIKFVTILADSFGSMSPKEQKHLVDYHKVLQNCIDIVTGEQPPIQFREHLIAKGLDLQRLNLFTFQKVAQAAGKDDDVLLGAACGRGKTLASYLWAAGRPDRKLIYCLPTTATATQINRDYVREGRTSIRHSRQAVDEMLAERLDERLDEKGIWGQVNLPATPEETDETWAEIQTEYAGLVSDFKSFRHEVTHATVDQVLGILAYSHRSIMWLLYMVDAQIVFDEFHCYDATMQQWFTKFLKWFPGIRIMCMSATIADTQSEAVLAARHRKPVTILDDEKDSPIHRPRYRFHVVTREEAEKHFTNGALWIVNQVKVAQEIGKTYSDAVVCHSRFGYKDRVRAQHDMVEKFRNLSKGVPTQIRAVATQVAENSLDISSCPMIAEIADPATLIQRVGRCNREANNDKVADVYFYMPKNGKPYWPSGSLSAFGNLYLPWLQSLEGRDLSQEDLNQAFRAYKGHNVPKDVNQFLPMTSTKRRDIRQQQTATLGVWEKDLPTDPKERRRMPMRKLQAIEMPLYLTPEERKALIAQDKWIKYRYILSEPNYHYDKRLGLVKFSDFEGAKDDGDK